MNNKNTFLSNFTSKETKFFPLLNTISDIIVNVSEILKICIERENQGLNVKENYESIKLEETKADNITDKVLNELSRTFITPFDREDIHDLVNYLDDVVDEIYSCVKKIYLYNPHKLTKEVDQIADILHKGALLIQESVYKLENLKKEHNKIAAHCKELHELENIGDDLYAEFITRIFKEEKDPVEIIKLKDIVAGLEKATDCADHVGKTIRTIIVKYS